jgi:UDP-N-acetylmuramate dehydrogenase
LRLGGAADIFDLKDQRDLPAVVDEARRFDAPPVCLGWGSNVLVSDTGTDVPVLLMRTSGIDVGRQHQGHVLLTVQAGHSLPDLVAFTVTEGLIGIETLAGVPGTVGAMPIQNVGAYGQETADTLREVVAWDWQLQRRVILTADQCALGHRTSVFKRSHRWTILQVTFALTPSPISAPVIYGELADALDVQIGSRLPTAEVASAVIAVRRRKGMVLDPTDPDSRSVGSIFLSPVIDTRQAEHLQLKGASPHVYSDGHTRVGASWLLRDAGYRLGQTFQPGIRISTKHYTLVADDGATAANFATAADSIRNRVSQATGVTLTFEPDLIGHDPAFLALTHAALTADV